MMAHNATAQYWVLASCSPGFEACDVLRGDVSHSPNPQPGVTGLCIYVPRKLGAPDIPLGFE